LTPSAISVSLGRTSLAAVERTLKSVWLGYTHWPFFFFIALIMVVFPSTLVSLAAYAFVSSINLSSEDSTA
jgi:hypothetical protein